ncbi:5-hydroxyisourate hydrolase [Halyomorpha halys]|uniref:5-hydroxyisourate hydrolase n=1 Tax=Halyomorpha halys TaxID=286706 RepID=UPI0006D50ED6|nr:5-hydroxyisourate hydrolase [Halyomorpha halys]
MSYYFKSLFIIIMSLRLQVLSNHISTTMAERPKISTHVLDTSRGLPGTGISVSLYYFTNNQWTLIKESITNSDGRCQDLITPTGFAPGRYKLHYETENYFAARNTATFFPFIEVVFDVRSKQEHYHVPLLLNPFGYSTYRGT